MTVIRQEDFIATVHGALQYISYYHPVDYIKSLAKAFEREQSPAARDAMAQILINSRMCAEGHRPICQDTGIVNAFVKVGMNVHFSGPADGSPTMDLAGNGRMRASAALISIPRTSSALHCKPILLARARTPRTTRPRPFLSSSSRATKSRSPSPLRAEAPRPNRSLPCSTPRIRWWSGS